MTFHVAVRCLGQADTQLLRTCGFRLSRTLKGDVDGMLRLHTSNIGFRLVATLLGLGYSVVGAYVLYISDSAPQAHLADRAFWLGVTFLIAGVAAISVTWLVSDLSNIWCRPPKRWRSK